MSWVRDVVESGAGGDGDGDVGEWRIGTRRLTVNRVVQVAVETLPPSVLCVSEMTSTPHFEASYLVRRAAERVKAQSTSISDRSGMDGQSPTPPSRIYLAPMVSHPR